MPKSPFRLFEDLAHRYDLHTPPKHYRHDHAFVLEIFDNTGGQILDVGCGTGVFLQKAQSAGFDVSGIDVAEGMVKQAASKVGDDRVSLCGMEALEDKSRYDGLCALSWVINYASDAKAVRDILSRFHRALRPGGRLVLQTAHAANMDSTVLDDLEAGPTGIRDDIVFLFQFKATGQDTALARYVYAAKSLGELTWEEHPLAVADAHLLARLCGEVGFINVDIYNSWHRDPLSDSISPWITAQVPEA